MSKIYWHITGVNEQGQPVLGRGDGRLIVVGETLTVEGNIKICARGLHACGRLLDCLEYCQGAAIQKVEMGPDIITEGNKSVSSSRKCIAILPADVGERILREFARWCALQVAHLWGMPLIVRQYLETGKESLRAAAWDATRDAAWAATRAAAWDAARAAAWDATRDAAWAATRAAAWDAARDAAWDAAWAAARDAARDAFMEKADAKLIEMVEAAFMAQESL